MAIQQAIDQALQDDVHLKNYRHARGESGALQQNRKRIDHAICK